MHIRSRWHGVARAIATLLIAVAAVAVMGGLSACTASQADGKPPIAAATSAGQAAVGQAAVAATTVVQQAANGLPPVTFTTASGDKPGIYVEIADTPDLQETGLMHRTSMPADQGMIFIFTRENQVAFWMKDTLISLSIAFIDSNGVVVDIQEMQAESLDNHFPAKPYQYAVEANTGWYGAHGIQVGDTADLKLAIARSPVFGGASDYPKSAP